MRENRKLGEGRERGGNRMRGEVNKRRDGELRRENEKKVVAVFKLKAKVGRRCPQCSHD